MKLKTVTDSLSYVKSHPEIFLNYEGVQRHELATKIVTDIASLGHFPATIDIVGDWWIVMSPSNWMQVGECNTEIDIFHQLIPNPRAGQNASRNEVVLNAFVKNLLVSKEGNIQLVKGAEESFVVDVIKNKYRMFYLIAFC